MKILPKLTLQCHPKLGRRFVLKAFLSGFLLGFSLVYSQLTTHNLQPIVFAQTSTPTPVPTSVPISFGIDDKGFFIKDKNTGELKMRMDFSTGYLSAPMRSSSTGGSGNLVPNSGFEDKTDMLPDTAYSSTNRVVFQWEQSSAVIDCSTCGYFRVSTATYGGSSSLSFYTGSTVTDGTVKASIASALFEVQPGTTYTSMVDLRSDSDAALTNVAVQVAFYAGNATIATSKYNTGYNAAGTYEQVTDIYPPSSFDHPSWGSGPYPDSSGASITAPAGTTACGGQACTLARVFITHWGNASNANAKLFVDNVKFGMNLTQGNTNPLNASYVSAGAFGSNTGGGTYSFPGNVGIGTTGPGAKLDVIGGGAYIERTDATSNSSKWALALRRSNSGGAGADGIGVRLGFAVETETEGTIEDLASIEAIAVDATAGTLDGQLQFGTTLNGSLNTARMVLDNNGNVGIGTTGPGYLLDVNGTAEINTLSIGGTAVTATATELNYVDGVTSAIQTQFGTKANLASPTFTGTVTIPTPFTIGAVSMTATGTELNILDGVTGLTAAELTNLGGVTATAAELNILTAVTATAAELNLTDGLTTTAARLNYLTSAGGTTGTTSTNIVFSTSPTLVTPVIGVATGTSLDLGTTTLYASRAITVDTGGVLNIALSSAAGDDFTVDTNKLVVEGDTGNVGIGTTGPGTKLEVAGGSAGAVFENLRLRNSGGATTGTGEFISFYDSSGERGRIETASTVGSLGTWGSIRFYTARNVSGSTLTEAMRISEGNVGIGTTAPAHELDVVGDIYMNSEKVAIKPIINSCSSSAGVSSTTSTKLVTCSVSSGKEFLLLGLGIRPHALYTDTVYGKLRIYYTDGTYDDTQELSHTSSAANCSGTVGAYYWSTWTPVGTGGDSGIEASNNPFSDIPLDDGKRVSYVEVWGRRTGSCTDYVDYTIFGYEI